VFGEFTKPLGKLDQTEFKQILMDEQKGYLDDMVLPPGIAKNAALLENVFVVMVCILNKIPVFVVGKPGIDLPFSFLPLLPTLLHLIDLTVLSICRL
jgi:hypothetical protein